MPAFAFLLVMAAAPPPTDTDAAASSGPAGGDIVVTGQRERGAVQTSVKPIDEVNAQDVQAMGASSVDDVLAQLAPETDSGRGRGGQPVILLNGRRISNYRELRDLPPEAIQKVEIFPEEVALQYGYSPDQRVVNIILKDNFAQANVEFEVSGATAGGGQTVQPEGSFTRIGRSSRLNIAARVQHQTLIDEAQRGIVEGTINQPYALAGNVVGVSGGAIAPALGNAIVAAVPNASPSLADFQATAGTTNPLDTTPYRSLRPRDDNDRINATYNRALSKLTDVTGNISYTLDDSRVLLGLPTGRFTLPGTSPFNPLGADVAVARAFTVPGALTRHSTTATAEAGLGMNTKVAGFDISFTNDYSHADTTVLTTRGVDLTALQAGVMAGTVNPFANDLGATLAFRAPDSQRSINESFTSTLVSTGHHIHLPAGAITTSLKVAFASTLLNAQSQTALSQTASSLLRDAGTASLNINLPIADRSKNVLRFLDTFSLNGHFGYTHLSDFGAVLDYGGGFDWAITDNLSLDGSYIGNQVAPGLGQLGNPLTITPLVPVFDPVTGQSVLATVTTGGNRALLTENRNDLKFGLNWRLHIAQQARVQLEYFHNRSSNVASGFPQLTPAIIAAFPDRITRDASGAIVAVDERPVNFAHTVGDRIKLGFNAAGPLGPAPHGQPGGHGVGPRFGGAGRGRWYVNMSFTQELQDKVLIRPGLPTLDLLRGDSTGSGGGMARSALHFWGGAFRSGVGASLSGNYQSATNLNGAVGTATGALHFAPLLVLNARVFVALDRSGPLTRRFPFLKGTRLQVRVNNIFNQVERVTDATGATPLAYQRGYLDPLGRVIAVELRRRF